MSIERARDTTDRAALGRFVASTLVLGAAAITSTLLLGPTAFPTDVTTVAVLVGLLIASVLVPLRVQHRGGSTGFTLDEGVVLALLFAVDGRLVPLIVAVTAATAHLLRRAELQKVLYNFGSRALCTSVAVGAFSLVGPGPTVLETRSVGAAVAAVAAYNCLNFLLTAGLRRRLTGASPRETWGDLRELYATTSFANTAYGLLLAFLAVQDAVATLLAGSLMVGLYLGYRGYAAMLEDRRRTERLHHLTRTLTDVTASDDSMRRFLQDLRNVVGAEGAALLLLESTGRAQLVRDGNATGDVGPCPFIEAARERGEPVLFGHAPDGGAHRDGLAAPVVYEGRVVGVIAAYDRFGLEPWDETDATLLGTIANEAAVALKNVELFAAVARERALLAEETRKLSDIVANASDGIAMIEADGRIAVWNDAMETVTGVDAAHAFSQPWDVVLRLRDRDGNELIGDNGHVFSRALRGERADEELDLQCLRRDGEWRWLRCSINPIERSGMGVVGAVLVARDVTRDREVEELKGDFVATVSHELRTPLTPLKGFLDTLIANGHRLSEEQRHDVHLSMRGQVQRLERLVGDLLLVADVERRELGLRPEPVDLPQVVAEALQRLSPPPAAGRVTVEAGDRVGAVGDHAALTRIVTSLLDNALKHTEGPVHVRVVRDGDQAVCEVRDQGPGIAPWDHERVFHRFGRLGNHLHRTQGPGLGLPISRALAQELGGDVTLESDLGSGATFRLTLLACALRAVHDAPSGVAPGTA